MKKTALFLSLAMLFATTACNQSQDTANTPTTPAPQQTTTEPESVVDKMKNYDEVSSFYSGLAAVKKDGKWGFIDKTGKEIIALQYDDARDFNQELAAVQKDGKWGFVDKTGKERSAMIYEQIWSLKNGYFAVQQDITNWNGGVYRWGIVDNFALEVVPIIQRNNQFISFSPDEGLFQFATTENRVGFTDKQGHEVVPFQYDNISAEADEGSICKEGLCVVAKNNLWGFVDTTGRLAIMLQYEYASDFNEGMAAVKQNDKWGFVDKTGKEVIALQYDSAHDFSEGLSFVKKGEQWLLIDKTGKEIAALPNYEWVEPFHNGLAKVVKNELVGFIDKNGKEVIACQYENIYDKDGTPFVGNGLLTVSQNEKWGLIDATGKEIVPPQYDEALNFEDDLALVSKDDNRWGFVDKNGNATIPLQYDFAYPFSDGLAFVRKDGQGQFIDKTGKVVIQSEVAEVSDKAETTTNSATPAEVPESISQRFPNIDPAQYATTKYTGKIAEDIADKDSSIRTRERKHLQYIRENPDEIGFAGHYTVMVFGVGGGAIQITVLDVITGEEVASMVVSSIMRKRYPDDDNNDEIVTFYPNYEYSVESRLFYVQGSVSAGEIGDDGSFVFELTDKGFKLLDYSPVMKASD